MLKITDRDVWVVPVRGSKNMFTVWCTYFSEDGKHHFEAGDYHTFEAAKSAPPDVITAELLGEEPKLRKAFKADWVHIQPA